MSPERWRQIEEVFHRVSDHDPPRRGSVLDEACGGDLELRLEVEGLLAHEEGAIASLELAIRSEIESLAFPLTGETVSHFVILEGLDGGGMGVVYRASDLRLGRMVAMKFLPEDSLPDPLAHGRFEREARAASALEHPNICPIYEFGEHEGKPFLVMPLLEGQTLRELIATDCERNKGLDLDRLLDLGIQTLKGLDAAHRFGLIHRDIKPGNLFVTRHGEVKILDFGLVKQAASNDVPIERAAAAWRREPLRLGDWLSCAGAAIGTAAYMSPEQVWGQALDARTDLYSFGLVLFEMATGRRPERDPKLSLMREEICAQLLRAVPKWNRKVRMRFEDILCRALSQEQDRRYQTAGEMCGDLEELNAHLESKRQVKSRGLSMVMVVILTGAGATYFGFSRTSRTAAVAEDFRLRQLTSNSPENHLLNGAISPDGKYLAYTDVKGLHLRRLDTGETRMVELTGLTLDTYNNDPAWFPDSLSFLVNTHDRPAAFIERTPSDATIWRVFVSGNEPQRVRENAFAWGVSPDGLQIAFGTHDGARGPREVWLMGSHGDNARMLYATDEAHQVGPFTWSPDGQRLNFVRDGNDGDIGLSIDLRGNPPIENASDEEMKARPGSLLLPNRKVVYSLLEKGMENTCNFWSGGIDPKTLKPIGKMHRMTNWTGFCMDPTSATADGKKIAFLKWTSSRTIYIADLNPSEHRMEVFRHFTLDETGTSPVGWLPDGKTLVFWSLRDGSPALFRQGLKDDSPQFIAPMPGDMQDPVLTGDGKWIVARVGPAAGNGDRQVMHIPVQGGRLERIGTMKPGAQLSCAQGLAAFCILAEPTADRHRLILSFFDPVHGKGIEITQLDLNEDGAWSADIAPDGTRIALIRGASMPIGIYSLKDHRMSWISPATLTLKQSLRWDRKGRGIYVTNGVKGGSEIFHVSLEGITRKIWHNDGTFPQVGLESPDGRHLALQDSKLDVNMWLLEIQGKI